MDMFLDRDSHDVIFVNGSCPTTQDFRDVVAQRLKITLYTFLGEWFLNTAIGVPYYEQIFGKVRSKGAIDIIFQNIIQDDEGVLEILSFESELDSASRSYSMTFSVRTTDNSVTLPITISTGG